MNTRKTSATLALILVCLVAPAAHARQRPARYETVRFESKLVGRVLPYNVVLPAGYHRRESRSARYPVVFLLHGLTGHYDNWVTKTKLVDYARPYDLIIVTPEGNNGWYTDSATAPADRYESYVIRELIPEVERRYRAMPAREGRAVAGLSMGGYGALKFGVKYPELFALAASMSGAVGAASWSTEDQLPRGLIRESILRTFGPADGAVKAENDLFKLVGEMPEGRAKNLPFLYLDCGTEDALRLLPTNLALANLLAARKIPHEYRQLPGDHDWAYWDKQVQEVLRLAAAKLAAPSRAAAADSRR
ncbi:MAG TPA: alpha/beta hydrolase family protein [Pyrinomonadaceae bacterium]